MYLDEAVVIVLAGGAGERLYPLTRERAKPAVYFGGPYRIIDFTLSNCINSGLRRIYIATQYKSLSLNRHVRLGWNVVSDELGEFIEVLTPQKRVGEHWYQGTADAVYQNLYSILPERPKHVIVLSGDHVYKMDYGKLLRTHIDRGASATIGVLEIPREEASRFGVLRIGDDDRVTGFLEKPKDDSTLDAGSHVLASMGIYVFETETLKRVLEEDAARETAHDFGRDILPLLIGQHPVYAHRFHDENKKEAQYWRDIGTLDAYYEANMDLCQVNPQFNLYDPDWPLRTHQLQAPPAKFVFADARRRGSAVDSIISAGCIISGSSISGSVLGPNVRVHSFCHIENSILMPGVRVGRHARIRNAIVDRDVFVPRGACIGYDPSEDAKRHTVSERGIVVVTDEDDPLIGTFDPEALAMEADLDRPETPDPR
ncbi:MAG: glucose-1-phosphate adenylyltransferase [Acidobacteriota bacterium]|nr:glucose-1-phosphate adenylyltransferase [Acidobacteriota bacterium]